MACVEFWHLCHGHSIAGFPLPKSVEFKHKLSSIVGLLHGQCKYGLPPVPMDMGGQTHLVVNAV